MELVQACRCCRRIVQRQRRRLLIVEQVQQLQQRSSVWSSAAMSPPPAPLAPSSTLASGNFDTYRFVQRLEADGFSREKAEAVMNSLGEVLKESTENIIDNSISRVDFEKRIFLNRVDFNALRSDITQIESSELGVLKTDTLKLLSEIERHRLRLAEELRRVNSNVRLELSVEKGRARDVQSAQEVRIREFEARVESEVAGLRSQLETVQWDLFKALFPLFCAAGALAFSYLRFVK